MSKYAYVVDDDLGAKSLMCMLAWYYVNGTETEREETRAFLAGYGQLGTLGSREEIEDLSRRLDERYGRPPLNLFEIVPLLNLAIVDDARARGFLP